MMISVFGIIAPVSAVIVMGAVTNHRRLIDPAGLRGINDLVFYAALPALLFVSVADAPHLRLADVAATFLGAAVVTFIVGVLVSRLALRGSLARSAVFGINATYGNTVMLGIPMVSAAYGPEGLANLLAIIAFHSVVLLPMASVLIEADSPRSGGIGPLHVMARAVQGTFRNPVILAIALAFAWRATGLEVPDALHRLLLMVAPAAPPLALFCLGASLPHPSGWSGFTEIAVACGLKLVAMPMLAAGLAWLAGLDGIAFKVVVLTAALPTGANAFLLARRSAMMAEASAGVVVVATLLSILSLTALLIWL